MTAGVINGLNNEVYFPLITGASAGAINAVVVATGIDIKKFWFDFLEQVPISFSFSPIHFFKKLTIFSMREPADKFLDERLPIEELKNSKSKVIISFSCFEAKDKRISLAERLKFHAQYFKFFRKKSKIKNEVLDLSNIENMDLKFVMDKIRASSTPPILFDDPIKIGSKIFLDGQLTDQLGAAEKIFKNKPDGILPLLIISRYHKGTKKYNYRLAKIKEFCQTYNYPNDLVYLISPDQRLPAKNNGNLNYGKLTECYKIGKMLGQELLNKL
jgi:predicted patatin/cPLA2 family phospholipase